MACKIQFVLIYRVIWKRNATLGGRYFEAFEVLVREVFEAEALFVLLDGRSSMRHR